MKRLLTIPIVAAFFVLTGCCTPHKTTFWEYHVIEGLPGTAKLDQALKEASAQGFVIQSSMAVAPAAGGDVLIVILKRPAR